MTRNTRRRMKKETQEEIMDKLRNKNEMKRKRLHNKMEKRIKVMQRKKEMHDEEEAKEEQEKMRKEFEEEMAKHDEEARIFYPDEKEWQDYLNQVNVGLKKTHPSIAALQSAESSCMIGEQGTDIQADESEGSQDVDEDSDVKSDEIDRETVSRAEARKLLNEHIASVNEVDKTLTDQDMYDSDSTTLAGRHSRKQKNPLNGYKVPKTTTIVYCKAKILIKQSENPTSSMIKVLGSYLTTLLKVDKSLLLFKYKDKTNTSFINRPTQIPDTPSKIKNFFHGKYRPKTEAYQIWPEIKIGINLDPEVFFEDVKCLLEDKKLGALFKKELQAEETEEIGFFLFSNRFQDKKRQMKSISKRIVGEFKFTPTFNLRWKNIYDPTNRNKKMGSAKLQNDDTNKATHIEVIKGEESKIVKAISKIYSSTRNDYPDFEKMRFIPSPKYTQNSGLKERYSELINRQNWYIQGIEKGRSYEIANLDTKASSLPTTAREMIMTMHTAEGKPLFTSVDPSWDTGITITFPKAYEELARNRIADLGPYLKHLHGEMVLVKYFTPDAALRARDCTWDSKTMRAISQMDKNFDSVLKECDDIDWLSAPPMKTAPIVWNTNQSNSDNPQPLFQHLPNEDQSLGTFGDKSNDTSNMDKSETNLSHQSGQKRGAPLISPDKTTASPRKRIKNINKNVVPDSEDLTDDDAETIDTLSSRMSLLETGAKKMEDKLDTLIGLLSKKDDLRHSTASDITSRTPEPRARGGVL